MRISKTPTPLCAWCVVIAYYSRVVMDQQGKITSLWNHFSLSSSPFVAPENLVSRDRFDRLVPRQPAHSAHSGWIWWYTYSSWGSSSFPRRRRPSGQSSPVYQVTQLRTFDVHCRESAGAGRASSRQGKVVPVTITASSGITMDQSWPASRLLHHPILLLVQ